ncbi:MAG: hypothetical protein SH868_12375 [Bythopirellula sp.]|nr:hypothetical protein [Bythopirellula sp.]
MGIELLIHGSGKFIVCRVTDEMTAHMARQVAVAVEQFSAQTGIKARLIDVREVRNTSSVSKNYDLAYKDLEELRVVRANKAAVLVSPDDSSHDFAMTAVKNAGFNVRKFTDEAAAIAWLEED